MTEKSPEAFKTISEAAEEIGVEQHVLRFWETKFTQIKPLKRRGGRRFYRPEDMEVLHTIRNLLYKQGFTIQGAKQALSSRQPQPAQQEAVQTAKAQSRKTVELEHMRKNLQQSQEKLMSDVDRTLKELYLARQKLESTLQSQ